MVAGIRKTSKRQHPRQQTKPKSTSSRSGPCIFCGGSAHKRDKCPVQESQCNYCHKIGHWENACLQKQRTTHKGSKQKSAGRQKQTVHELHREEPNDIEFDELNFDCIDTSADGTEAYASIKIKPFKNQIANLHGKIDTGSQGNVLPLRTYHKMYSDDSKHIKHSSTLLTAYNGTPIKQFGYITLPCSYKNKSMTSYIAKQMPQ